MGSMGSTAQHKRCFCRKVSHCNRRRAMIQHARRQRLRFESSTYGQARPSTSSSVVLKPEDALFALLDTDTRGEREHAAQLPSGHVQDADGQHKSKLTRLRIHTHGIGDILTIYLSWFRPRSVGSVVVT
jgi:hypothetical protein